jgi:hypothetical protein
VGPELADNDQGEVTYLGPEVTHIWARFSPTRPIGATCRNPHLDRFLGVVLGHAQMIATVARHRGVTRCPGTKPPLSVRLPAIGQHLPRIKLSQRLRNDGDPRSVEHDAPPLLNHPAILNPACPTWRHAQHPLVFVRCERPGPGALSCRNALATHRDGSDLARHQ